MSPRTSLLISLALASVGYGAYAETQSQSLQLAAVEAKWQELGATGYRYKLRVGGVFGAGEYRVEVRGDKCRSWHIGGIGLGHAKFLERFQSEPTCHGRLIAELLKNVQFDVARGYTLTDLEIDAHYGFLRKAYIDTSVIDDQGWGFEIMDFEVLSTGKKGT